MIEWAERFLKLLPIAADTLAPGKRKEVLTRLGCHAVFHDIRKNHHLKRALRLSWASAAQAVVNAAEADASSRAEPALRRQLDAFVPVFDAAMKDLTAKACDLKTENDLPDSVIDGFILHFIEGMPEHLAFNGGGEAKDHVTKRFLDDLRRATCAPDELPVLVVARARAGVSKGGDTARSFGTLMFDDFARIIQDPGAYPEARASFEQLQYQIHKDLSRLNLDISRQLAQLVAGVDEKLDQALAHQPADWLASRIEIQFVQLAAAMEEHARYLRQLKESQDRSFQDLRDRFDKANARANPLQPSPASSLYDPLNQTPATDRTRIIHYCLFDDQSRFNDIKQAIFRVLDNLQTQTPLDIYPWLVRAIEERERQNSGYLHNAVQSLYGKQHIGSVLEITGSLGVSIAGEQRFVDRLCSLGWDAASDVGQGVDLELTDDPVRRAKAAGRGAFPLTVETRLALSALMEDKHLAVLLRTPRSEVSTPVAAFLGFLEKRGVAVDQAEADDIDAAWVLRYLQKLLGIAPTYIENPYPKLEHFSVDDAARYHGREHECQLARDALARRSAAGRSAVLGVRGPSGCGKSSFVQARLVASLLKEGHRHLTLRRTDMLGSDGETVAAARKLCEQMRTVLGLPAEEEVSTFFRGPSHLVVASCCQLLDQMHRKAGHPAVVVCLDQFEEIVDDLADDRSVPEWRALLGIVDHLAAMPGVCIVFTLEDSRFDKLASSVGASVLAHADWIRLEDPGELPLFLRTVVEEPLRQAGFELDPDIVTRLVDESIELDQSNGDIGSPLPLLSLKMHNLFRQIRAQGLDGDPKAPLRIGAGDLSGASLSIADEIEALAEEAWMRANAEDEDIGHFLRPLVRLSTSDALGARTNIVLGAVSTREFAAERKLDRQFNKLRLLVPAANGLRLVHESVIHRWKRAAQWFAETREELAREADLRKEAEDWHARGRPPVTDAQRDRLDAAVKVLHAHIRNWATDQPLDLPDAERHLCAYACALFDLSETPLAPVPNSRHQWLHIHLAASFGRLELLRRFAALAPEAIEKETSHRRRALHCAAFSQAGAVALLLEQHADVRAVDTSGATALDIATYVQREDIVDLLLAAIPDGAADLFPGFPLTMAAMVGHTRLAAKLEHKGFRHAPRAADGWAPLHTAAENGDLEAFRYFLARGDATLENKDKFTPIDIAASNGHWKLIHEALPYPGVADLLAGKRSNGATTLMHAAFQKRYKTIEMLLPFSDPNATLDQEGSFDGFTALHCALNAFDKDRENASQRLRLHTARTVEALLSSTRTDVLIRAKDKSAFEMARGLPATQEAILAHPSFDPLRPMANGWSELMRAANEGDQAQVMRLLERTRDRTLIDHVSEDGKSLALLLLQNNMGHLVRPMIKAGEVNPWRPAPSYPGLLMASDTEATQDIHQWVIDRIPDQIPAEITIYVLNQLIYRDAPHDTAQRLAKLVLAHTDASDPRRLSASMVTAARFGQLGIFDLLQEHGVVPDLPDGWGRHIMDLASETLRDQLLARARRLS